MNPCREVGQLPLILHTYKEGVRVGEEWGGGILELKLNVIHHLHCLTRKRT